ncbi:MAG: outer membrane protein nutrient binding [Ferruginibacter sp.]|nr:outer membrane protein nutrient binding [Ferruginibacter sp.]
MRKHLLLFIPLLFLAVFAHSQAKVITGKIVEDKEGTPLTGATIKAKGSTKGTQTGADGSFRISVPAGTQRLAFTMIGYVPQEVDLAGQTVLNIVLTKEERRLEEVVITSFGIRRSDKALGYSVGKVDPATLLQKSEPDVLKSLQGKVAGVDIRTSQGTPGAATRIQIRGNSSFFGDNQPLIVVDGVPYSNDQVTTSSQTSGGTAYSSGISNLDPNDIASMSVLKGSSAAALYGSRASNGVLIITTKSGSAARSRKGLEINYSSSASMEKIANLPQYQNDYGTGANFLFSPASNGSWGPAFSSRDSVPNFASYQAAYPELFPASGNIKYQAFPNNVKNLFNTGSVFENSIGVNGGDEKSSVALTASQLTQNGYVPNSSFNRANVGLGGATKLSIGLNVRGNLSYSRSTQKGGFFGENQVGGAASLFARSLFLGRNWDTDLPYQDKAGNNLTWNGGGQFDNPEWSAKNNIATTHEERTIAGIHFDFNVNKWIRVDYNLGNNVNALDRREITEISSRAAEGLGRIVVDNYRKQEIESNLLLTFNPTINKDFGVKLVAGNNINQRTTTRQIATGNKFITRGTYTLGNTSQQIFGPIVNGVPVPSLGDYYERQRLTGVYGDLSLSYKNFAFLDVTGRNDWSSTLPKANRSYFYPSVSGSLIVTDALKMQSNILDFAKLRAGWAKVGRDALPYSLDNVFNLSANILGQPTATVAVGANDPNLKPEFTTEIEVGTQLSFFIKRIDVDFSWYNRNSTNLIAPISIPSSSGYSTFNTNYGRINNTGIEIDLTVKPVQTKNVTWAIHAAYTRNRNIVKELIEGVDRLNLKPVFNNFGPYLEAGKPFGFLRGEKILRDSATGAILINPGTGAMIKSNELDIIGDPNPDYKLGITNSVSYKGFFLSALFDMTIGGDINTVTVSQILSRGVSLDTKDRLSDWIIPGILGDPSTGKAILDGGKTIPNTIAITTNDLYFSPNTNNGATFGGNTAAEWNTYDATVYRLREVTIGYEFPKSFFKKLPIGSATLSVSGRNLWFLAPNFPKYTNFDPEVNSYGASSTQGIELSAAPTTKRYGINLKVNF